MCGVDKVEKTEEAIEAILLENLRRRENNSRKFDPISGEGSIGPRFKAMLKFKPTEGPREVYLPTTMKDLRLTRENYEELRLLHDFAYWAARCVKVKRKGGGDDVEFLLNRPQRRLVEMFEDMRRRDCPIRVILLKARQWGGSTCAQIYMAWLQIIHSRGLNSLIIAHQAVASYEIMDMFERMVKNYPEKLTMKGVGSTRNTFRLEESNCKIKVGTAERPDSCRGGDYNLVHCSEVGIWKQTGGKQPEDIVRAACSGVLLTPMTMIVFESTANGTGNYFHREYQAAKNGYSQFKPLFISWFEVDHQYSLPFRDEAERRDFALRLWEGRDAETPRNERSQPGAYMWWLWQQGATLESLAWYEAERSKYSDHDQMAAEYPSDDVEAFANSGAHVFDHYKVEQLSAGCDYPAERGDIRDGEFIPERTGDWQVWKRREEMAPGEEAYFDNRYLVVVDVGGRSAKSDWSVIAVFDRRQKEGPEVVAQWRGHTDFDLLTRLAADAARYYHDALLVIESNTLETHDRERNLEGDQSHSILSRLREEYWNLYQRGNPADVITHGGGGRYGFHTNIRTKPMIISTLVEAIRDGLYTERDKECLNEYRAYERRQNGSYGAITGHHDDLLMTRAIGLHLMLHELPPLPEPPRSGDSPQTHRQRRRPNFASF